MRDNENNTWSKIITDLLVPTVIKEAIFVLIFSYKVIINVRKNTKINPSETE
jgi:hypothetical protein